MQKHAAGKKHREKVKLIKTSRNIVTYFKEKKLKQSVAVKEAEIRIASMFSEHNIAFQVADHFIQVIKKSFIDSEIAKNLKLNRTKCTGIIKNVLTTVESDESINNFKNVKFSVLVDENTDITDHKFMCTLVRYISPLNGLIRTELLEINSTGC